MAVVVCMSLRRVWWEKTSRFNCQGSESNHLRIRHPNIRTQSFNIQLKITHMLCTNFLWKHTPSLKVGGGAQVQHLVLQQGLVHCAPRSSS